MYFTRGIHDILYEHFLIYLLGIVPLSLRVKNKNFAKHKLERNIGWDHMPCTHKQMKSTGENRKWKVKKNFFSRKRGAER